MLGDTRLLRYEIHPGLSRCGALLLLSRPACFESLRDNARLKEYTKDNFQSWVDFANSKGYDLNGLDGLAGPILVTGHTKTSKCTKIVWNLSGAISVNGDNGVQPAISGEGESRALRIQVRDESNTPVEQPHNQCIFINYYTVRRRRFLPPLVKAAAGPSSPGDIDRGPPPCSVFLRSRVKTTT